MFGDPRPLLYTSQPLYSRSSDSQGGNFFVRRINPLVLVAVFECEIRCVTHGIPIQQRKPTTRLLMNCHMYCRRVNTFYLQIHQWFEDSIFGFVFLFYFSTTCKSLWNLHSVFIFYFSNHQKTNPLYCSGPTACKTTAKNWKMTTCRSPQCAVSLRVTSRPSRGEGTWASWAASPLETVLPHLKILGRCGIVDRTTTKQTLWLNKMRLLPLRSEPGRAWIHSLDEYALVRGHHLCHGCSESPKSEVAFREKTWQQFFKTHWAHFDTSRCLGSPAWTGIY